MNKIAIAGAALAISASAFADGPVNVGGIAVGSGTIYGTSSLTGNSVSTAVSNLAGTGSSNFSTANQTGGNNFIGGAINSQGLSTVESQSTYSNVQTKGDITGNAQPMSGSFVSNGAGSFGTTSSTASVNASFSGFQGFKGADHD